MKREEEERRKEEAEKMDKYRNSLRKLRSERKKVVMNKYRNPLIFKGDIGFDPNELQIIKEKTADELLSSKINVNEEEKNNIMNRLEKVAQEVKQEEDEGDDKE